MRFIVDVDIAMYAGCDRLAADPAQEADRLKQLIEANECWSLDEEDETCSLYNNVRVTVADEVPQ